MRLQHLFTDDDAVSPVIGVILMVAITVILAAVIGAFVLGIGDEQANAPSASWDAAEQTNTVGEIEAVNLTHDGGDGIDSERLSVAIGGDREDVTGDIRITAGNSVDIDLIGTASSYDRGSDLRLVWSPEGNDDTTTIRTHTLTNASDSGLDAAEAN